MNATIVRKMLKVIPTPGSLPQETHTRCILYIPRLLLLHLNGFHITRALFSLPTTIPPTDTPNPRSPAPCSPNLVLLACSWMYYTFGVVF